MNQTNATCKIVNRARPYFAKPVCSKLTRLAVDTSQLHRSLSCEFEQLSGFAIKICSSGSKRGGHVRKKIYLPLAVVGLIWWVPGHSATCSLPVTLTNGSLADATQVMSDLNAAASCAGAAVTPSGTPTAGSLAVFSGPSAIGPGNLSGDVATSGSTVTSLATTGVTAGSYTNANITIDGKGRVLVASNGTGGSGGSSTPPPIVDGIPVGRPAATAFTQRNFGTATIVDHAGGPVTLTIPPSSGDQLRGVELAVPTSSTYTVTAKISPFLWNSNFFTSGIYIADSSGKLVTLDVGQASSYLFVTHWNSVSSFNNNMQYVQFSPLSTFWLRINNDGTNFNFYISNNGADWIHFYSEPNSSFLTGSPVAIGVYGDSNDTANLGLNTTISVWSFEVETGTGTNSQW